MSENNQLALHSLEDLKIFSEMVAKSGLAPRSFDTAEKVLLAIVYGKELGISAMQSLQGLSVISGRICISGDLARSLCEPFGIIEDGVVGEPNTESRGVSVQVSRANKPTITRTFTIADAKRAHLWDKPGPWTEYPQRMIYYRALGFALRDGFSDVLKGLKTTEEVADYPVTEKPANVPSVDNSLPTVAQRLPNAEEQAAVLEERKKRHRRTKAEMEAARAAEEREKKAPPLKPAPAPEPSQEVYVDASGAPDDLEMGETVEGLSEASRAFVEAVKAPSIHDTVRAKLEEDKFSQESFMSLLRQFKLTRAVMLDQVDAKTLETVLSKWDVVQKRLSAPSL